MRRSNTAVHPIAASAAQRERQSWTHEMNSKNRILIALIVGVLAYPASYSVLRGTKFLVRREWLEIHPHSRTHERTIYGSDVGHGSYFDSNFKPKKGPFTVLFYPLWQGELRLRKKYFYHDNLVVIHEGLLESNNPGN
jgi:hypothetical protein